MDEQQKKLDHENYHRHCDRKPPEGLSECELVRWEYKRALKCDQLRRDWEQRWGNSFTARIHNPHLILVKNQMKNAAERIAKYCKN